MLHVKKIGLTCGAALMVACSGTKKADVPPLSTQAAAELLQFDNKAHNWLQYVQKHDKTCEYKVDLPDQASQPTEIDADHIMWCGGRQSSKEYDASAVFTYDKEHQRWILARFSS